MKDVWTLIKLLWKARRALIVVLLTQNMNEADFTETMQAASRKWMKNQGRNADI